MYLKGVDVVRFEDERIGFVVKRRRKWGMRFEDGEDGWRIELDG